MEGSNSVSRSSANPIRMIAGLLNWVCNIPTAVFEGDKEAERQGVYRRSHAPVYYDDKEHAMIHREGHNEYAVHSAKQAHDQPEFQVRVVEGKSQVVVKGSTPKSTSSNALEEFNKHLEEAAATSNNLLIQPLKKNAENAQGGRGLDGRGEIIGSARDPHAASRQRAGAGPRQ